MNGENATIDSLINEIERLRVQLVESEAKIIELQKENNWLQAKLRLRGEHEGVKY